MIYWQYVQEIVGKFSWLLHWAEIGPNVSICDGLGHSFVGLDGVLKMDHPWTTLSQSITQIMSDVTDCMVWLVLLEKGLHREWEFRISVSAMGFPQKW